jgi:hypothetical protein
MKWIVTNLKKHSEAIGAASSIFGLVIAVAGFWITIHQIIETKRTLQASNSYEIQRDARDLVDAILEGGELQRLISGEEISSDEKNRAKGSLWRMNNFYLSVFRQFKAGGVNEELTAAFSNDFCSFYSIEAVGKLWEEMISENKIGKSHLEMKRAWCK